jgi:hypothetical protein
MAKNIGSVAKPSRRISGKTTLFLYVQAGGRCEFDGCNEYLLEHYPTETIGNFAEQAHIWAFSEGGPRGKGAGRPEDINKLSNLMLLCKRCHKCVDDNPKDYPIKVLKKFKKDHEDRIYDLTGIAKDRDTVPLVLKGMIGGRPADISIEEMQSAVAPNYLKKRDIVEINFCVISDEPEKSYWDSARKIIDRDIAQLHKFPAKADCTIRVSVFALAPIPLLIYLGAKLSDKMNVDLYQRHRDTERWLWKDGRSDAEYRIQRLQEGNTQAPVLLLINLSGKNNVASLPADLTKNATIYEFTLKGQDCSPLFLNTREDLINFTLEYNQALALIRQAHPNLDVLHLFPAVPAPVAITLGRARLPKVDATFKVYDCDKRANGFVFTLEVS